MFLAFALALLSVHPLAAAPSCRLADRRVEAFIARQAKARDGVEYCQYRLYNDLDDVDGDTRTDFIVVFTIEGMGGGNSHMSFMAVFLSAHPRRAPLLLQVGEKGVRDISSVEVRNARIYLSTLEPQPGDALCCPSAEGELVYRVVNGRLQQDGGA